MTYTFYSGYSSMLRTAGAEETAKYAASLGFTAVEPLGSVHAALPENPAEVRRVLEAHGLKTACYSIGITLYGENADLHEKILMDNVRCAAAMGAPYFHHTLILWLSLPENAPSYDEAMEAVLPRALRVAKYAESLGMTTLYEPQGMYFNGVDGLGKFYYEMKRLGAKVAICGDVGNPLFADADPAEIFRTFAPEIRHVHVKDYLRRAEDPADPQNWYITRSRKNWLRDALMGTGVIDFASCMNALKEVGYNGALAFENSHPEPFEDGVRVGMDLLRSLGM